MVRYQEIRIDRTFLKKVRNERGDYTEIFDESILDHPIDLTSVSDRKKGIVPAEFRALDDVCVNDKLEILNHLINMYDTNLGNTSITSNYSMGDWLKIATSGQNQMGLEGRLRTFFKEIEIVGNTKRKPTW